MGGSKKWFNNTQINIDENTSNIHELLNHLIKIKPEDTLDFNDKNLLIAVNGVDSSALNGYETKLKTNDIVSIIPIIHGGSQERIQFRIDNYTIELFEFKKDKNIDVDFLILLRNKFPHVLLQGISSHFILNKAYAEKIISISIYAKKYNRLLSKKLETDILLRFAGTTQIKDAIKNVGISKNQNFFIIAIGKKPLLDKIHKKIYSDLIGPFSSNNTRFLKKHFSISSKHIKSINSKTPLEDLLYERATILI
jgi:tRNA threonylcarbamoyladenosine modification (KEOPS) complex Cgi121 subunit/molybdopterin converting factor small subunit